MNELLPLVDQYELRVANALWGERTYCFKQPYLETISKYYGTGGVFSVDFRNDSRVSPRINAWVEEQTCDRIKEILARGMLDETTRLVLTNAIYFKGEWSEVFQDNRTKEDSFTAAGGRKVRVPLMHQPLMHRPDMRHSRTTGRSSAPPTAIPQLGLTKRISTPTPEASPFWSCHTRATSLSMIVILPQDADGLTSVEELLTAPNLHVWIGNLQERQVNVFLPKFKLEVTYPLGSVLMEMGMVRAFTDQRLTQFAGAV